MLVGLGVSALCAIVWGLAATLGRHASAKSFLVYHLGGMAVRLALAAGLCAWILQSLDVRVGVFVGSLVGGYALLVVVEVLWLAHRGRFFVRATRAGKETPAK
jgi:hypothetical protein